MPARKKTTKKAKFEKRKPKIVGERNAIKKKKKIRKVSKKQVKKPIKEGGRLTKKRVKEKKDGETEAPVKATKGIRVPALLRGMKDILPKEENFWKKMHHTAEQIATAYGFGFFEPPILEDSSLFIRSLGRGTDVVEKEMYVFEDRDGSKVCLRPEMTASAVRAYIGHGMQSYPQPVKLWYWGQMFRHDRPQAGRYRQFHQFGCETFGEDDAVVDAELITVAYNFLKDLGVETNVYINSLGTVEERQNYVVELMGYLRAKKGYLCKDCRRRMIKNPLRVLDCKAEQCQPILEEAPQIIDWLSDDSRSYLMRVLEYLDDMEIPYVLKSTLVRGLDYYTGVVFEIYEEEGEHGAQSALGGGGRYDLLVEQLGGPATPACGFSLGLERIVSILRRQAEEKKLSWVEEKPKVFFAQLGEQARRHALGLIENLRHHNIIVYHNLAKFALKAQLELANKYEVMYTLILGQKEVQDGTIIIRDMESGIQEIVDQKKLRQQLEKKLK